MIFITVGTEKYPFNRIFKIMDDLINERIINHEVFGQIGTSTYIPKAFAYRRFLSYPELSETIQRSDIVISHAGIGSIITCLNHHKMPILFPRNRQYKEHVDDHQTEFMKKAINQLDLIGAIDKPTLIEKITHYKQECNRYWHRHGYSDKDALVCYLTQIVNRGSNS